jgi:hypothetical protein
MKEEKKDSLKRKALEKVANKILKADSRFAKLKELGSKKQTIYNKLDKRNGTP